MKTPAELNADIREALKGGFGDTTTMHSDRCNTCGRSKASPYRRRDASGKIVEGCVDAAHTGHLYGESLRWHDRPSAKEFRKKMVERLRSMLTPSRRRKAP